MLPAIIFDLDGTLIDSAPDLGNALNKTLNEIDRPELELSLIRNLVGDGAVALIKRGLEASGGIQGHDIEALRSRFLDIYDEILLENTKLFPRALNSLNQLKNSGFPLAICTNKPEKPAKRILEGLKIENLFQVITGGDTFNFRKPAPRHLIKTIENTSRDKNFAIMIGDSENDISPAIKIKIPSIAVSFGYSNKKIEDLKSDLILNDFNDLYKKIIFLCSKHFNIKI